MPAPRRRGRPPGPEEREIGEIDIVVAFMAPTAGWDRRRRIVIPLDRWKPRLDYTKQEERLLKRLRKTRKLFAFLRDHRHELFDEAFQAELESMYRSTGAGKDATPPALLAMVVILQSYQGISDAEAVDLTVMDLRGRWCSTGSAKTSPPLSRARWSTSARG